MTLEYKKFPVTDLIPDYSKLLTPTGIKMRALEGTFYVFTLLLAQVTLDITRLERAVRFIQ